jgi:hypothetical protein
VTQNSILTKTFSAHDDICLFGIVRARSDDEDQCTKPGSVHRIPWIFKKPRFVTNHFVSDIKQGAGYAISSKE